ncbi:MAG: endonuclease/exonuclease/phosphatase family protein [Bacteroidetes bacterium]|nr:endonuclease/exonuclease/phosphatase family protein [Bacteroidota bacterium]
MTPITNIRLAWIAVFLLILLMPCSGQERENIEVITFNIRYDNPADGIFSWENRKDMVFWVIAKYDPDILGIQEALKSQVDELEEFLTEYSWLGAGRNDGHHQGEYVPIFFKKDRFMLAEEGHFWLSKTPEIPGSMGWDAACTRMVSWVKLNEARSGNEYFVFNTHFDHIGEEARENSARLLTDSILSIAGSGPVIITGDLNADPESGTVKVLSQLFSDSRLGAEVSETASGTTFIGFPADMNQGKIIDHIFVSKHFIIEEYEIISDNTGGYYPSDHLPVWVCLQMSAQ